MSVNNATLEKMALCWHSVQRGFANSEIKAVMTSMGFIKH
jgi:hypothetical protein